MKLDAGYFKDSFELKMIPLPQPGAEILQKLDLIGQLSQLAN